MGLLLTHEQKLLSLNRHLFSVKKTSHGAYLPSSPYAQFWCVHFSHHGILTYQKDKYAFKPT